MKKVFQIAKAGPRGESIGEREIHPSGVARAIRLSTTGSPPHIARTLARTRVGGRASHCDRSGLYVASRHVRRSPQQRGQLGAAGGFSFNTPPGDQRHRILSPLPLPLLLEFSSCKAGSKSHRSILEDRKTHAGRHPTRIGQGNPDREAPLEHAFRGGQGPPAERRGVPAVAGQPRPAPVVPRLGRR